ncbi:MAG: flavin reductase [Bacteroidales bacterium]|jgi:flavin reductase (DIM6/NTAB) family NADH-FMN oxidoreductase RutF|nr:flavin reductase [Bacteroidales bacterium]
MKNCILVIVMFTFLAGSCVNKKSDNENVETTVTNNHEEEFVKINATDIPDNVIKLISQDWMLITSGNKESFNTMTASWGALGEIWGKDASFIMVRDSRYTYEFLEENDYYTLSFFSENYRDALQLCGTKSGRDTDKVKESGLTSLELESGTMAFEEARLIIECRKLYSEPFKKESFTDDELFEKIYNEDDNSIHTLYIGEITNVWIKN